MHRIITCVVLVVTAICARECTMFFLHVSDHIAWPRMWLQDLHSDVTDVSVNFQY